jgi:hypothetical protein
MESGRPCLCTTDSHHSDPLAPHLLQRECTAPAPNRTWLTDITAIWTAEGWLYLAVVLDGYSRLIVGWAMAKHREASLVEAALWMALGWRQPVEELLRHSDRGSQSTSLAYHTVLAQFHMQVSMSGKGRTNLSRQASVPGKATASSHDVTEREQEQLSSEREIPPRRNGVKPSKKDNDQPDTHKTHAHFPVKRNGNQPPLEFLEVGIPPSVRPFPFQEQNCLEN